MSWTCTRREKHRCFGISLIVASIIACSVLVFVSLEYTGNQRKENYSKYARRSVEKSGKRDQKCIPTCSTEGCVLHAALLLDLMDPEIDQCDDFYSFSCGKYLENFGKEDNYSVYAEYTKRLNLELKDLLDNLEADPESASGKMKIVYDSCMNIRSSELEAVPAGLQFLREVGIPSWPNLPPDFEFTDPKLPKALGILAAHMEYAFISITNQIVDGEHVFNASIGRGEQFNGERGGVASDPNLMRRSLKYFGIEGEAVLDLMADFFSFVPLYTSSYRIEECESGNLTDVHLDCSQNVKNKWSMLCEIVDTFVDVANVSHLISKIHVVIPCNQTNYIDTFLELMEELPHNTIARLLGFHFFLTHLDNLNFYFRLIKKDAYVPGDVDYVPLPLSRWEHCIQWTTKHMVHALGHEYIKKVLTTPVLLEAKRIVEECFLEVMDLVHQQEWLTDKEKIFIIDKINLTTSLNLQMKMYRNETFVNDYYKPFHPTRESFLKNVLERQRTVFSTDKVQDKENQRIKDLAPFSVNAFESPDIIDIGLGNFRFPQYVPGQPRFINVIRLATSMGHELGHAIERALGNLTSNETSTQENFEDRKLCFQNQYSNFIIKSLNLNVDAIMTEAENLADSLSAILVDKLLEKYAASGEEYVLPSIPYTMKQLVYFLHSQFECTKTSKEKDQFLHEYDTHPHGRFRLTAMMQNSKGFSKVFNCQEGSYMNPSSKCLFLDEH